MPHLEIVFDFFDTPVLDHVRRIGTVAFSAGLQGVYILHDLHKNLHESCVGVESLKERAWCPGRRGPDPLMRDEFIIHLSRQLLVDVFIMKQDREAEKCSLGRRSVWIHGLGDVRSKTWEKGRGDPRAVNV